MTPEEHASIMAWAQPLAEKGAAMLHLPSLICGNIDRLYAGDGDDFCVSSIDGLPIMQPVLMIRGNAFLAKPENFVEMRPGELEVYTNMQAELRAAIERGVRFGKERLPDRAPILPLIVAAMHVQLRALECA